MINWTSTEYHYTARLYGHVGGHPGDCYTRVGYSYQIDTSSIDEEEKYTTALEALLAAGAAIALVWWYDDGDDTVRDAPEGPFGSEDDAHDAAEEAAAGSDEGPVSD